MRKLKHLVSDMNAPVDPAFFSEFIPEKHKAQMRRLIKTPISKRGYMWDILYYNPYVTATYVTSIMVYVTTVFRIRIVFSA